jgi:glycosyltransferase involved in cell wall biosynthesis
MLYPKISIITPNYNGDQFLEETIKSVLNQNYPNLEYIIIDGGSTDNSINIIRKYEDKLAYWLCENDKGIYHAIQKGFERSSGEIMAWINSDDMYHNKALFTIAEIFTSFKKVNWIVGATTSFDETGRTISCSQSRLFTKFDFYNSDFKWIQQESVFWRRSLWDKVGSRLNLTLEYAGDFELWLRFFEYEKLYVTHALIGGFRLRQSNQISLDHIDGYLMEVENLISSLELSDQDLKILKRYRKILFSKKIIQKLKLFRTDWLINKYRAKYFDPGKFILYDRSSAKFLISD